jgi:hypothetical protein
MRGHRPVLGIGSQRNRSFREDRAADEEIRRIPATPGKTWSIGRARGRLDGSNWRLSPA